MTTLQFDPAQCVRGVSKFSTCNACVQACPTQALTITSSLPSLHTNLCVSCGACQAYCPTEAFTLPSMMISSLLSDEHIKKGICSCQNSLSCLGGISLENWLTLLLTYGDMQGDISQCPQCPIGETILPLIHKTAHELSEVLPLLTSTPPSLTLITTYSPNTKEGSHVNRRDFLGKLGIKNLIKTHASFEEMITNDEIHHFCDTPIDSKRLTTKVIPEKRGGLFHVLKRYTPSSQTAPLSFSSQKRIDPALCTNCGLCHRLCPTGALTTSKWGADIFFNPLACVACSLCEEACETQCLHSLPTVNLSALYAPQTFHLIHHDVKRCVECGTLFKYDNHNVLCHRCLMLEEEASTLVGF